MLEKTFFNYKIEIKTKTTTKTGLKGELKYVNLYSRVKPRGITVKNNSVKDQFIIFVKGFEMITLIKCHCFTIR